MMVQRLITPTRDSKFFLVYERVFPREPANSSLILHNENHLQLSLYRKQRADTFDSACPFGVIRKLLITAMLLRPIIVPDVIAIALDAGVDGCAAAQIS